jgi:hypothetical protein
MKSTFAILTSSILLAAAAQACDLCGCPSVQHPWEPRAGLYFGAAEQFTRYKTLQLDGHEIDNDARQKLDSSITQIFLGYNVTRSIGVQVNVPLIERTFRRPDSDGGIEEGNVGGLGDVSLLAHWMPIYHATRDTTFALRLTGGLKFPTGDSDRVLEEAEEGHDHGAEAGGAHEEGHHEGEEHTEGETDHADEIPSGIHGHDLALGTGSLDGIFGARVHLRWKRVFLSGEVQYTLRGQGKHDYDFADDFLWAAGPGVTLIDQPTHLLAVQFVCSGETKGEDKFRGVRADDTSTTGVFLGPKFSASFHDRFTAEIGLDVPIHQENSGVQIVPDYRFHATVGWAF